MKNVIEKGRGNGEVFTKDRKFNVGTNYENNEYLTKLAISVEQFCSFVLCSYLF